MPEVKATRKFAHRPVVCRGCGFIIYQEGYLIVDRKAYHLKCENKAQEIIGEK